MSRSGTGVRCISRISVVTTLGRTLPLISELAVLYYECCCSRSLAPCLLGEEVYSQLKVVRTYLPAPPPKTEAVIYICKQYNVNDGVMGHDWEMGRVATTKFAQSEVPL